MLEKMKINRTFSLPSKCSKSSEEDRNINDFITVCYFRGYKERGMGISRGRNYLVSGYEGQGTGQIWGGCH